MVYNVHPLCYFSGRGSDACGAVDDAGGEVRVGGYEGGFPVVGEFVEDVGGFFAGVCLG